MSDDKICMTCKKPRAAYHCGICEGPLCKACSQFLTETFSFRPVVPPALKHTTYCGSCFDAEVSGPLHEYETKMEEARNLIVFTKEQSKITRLLKREAQVSVEACEDKDEAILRLAFHAAEQGYNCIVDVQISNRKIVIGSHKKTIFDGVAFPVTIEAGKIGRYQDQ